MIAQALGMTLTLYDRNCLQRKADLPNRFRLHSMRWCNMLGAQCTREHYAGARHYMYSLTYHVQLSGVGKKHLLGSSNRYGQHYRRLQRSAMNLSSVDAKKAALDAAGVRSLHFHVLHFAHVMGNATETRNIVRR